MSQATSQSLRVNTELGYNQANMQRLNRALEAQLRAMIRSMSRDSRLYKMLKQELKAQGHWKQKPRGKPTPNHNIGRSAPAQTYEPLSD